MRQHILKLAQPRFLRNAGRPVAIAAGQVTQGIVMQGSRVLFQSGHEARKVKRGGVQPRHYRLIRKPPPRQISTGPVLPDISRTQARNAGKQIFGPVAPNDGRASALAGLCLP
jgi:hypothetical protein